MSLNNPIIYSGIALLIAILYTYFLYVYKKRAKQKLPYLLLVLRFFSILALLLLLINPLWKTTKFFIEKPKLVIAVDNSASINSMGAQETVTHLVSDIQTNEQITARFDIQTYRFGSAVAKLDSLTFTERQTNHSQLLQQLKQVYMHEKSPVVMITDGNQTKGSSYSYFSSTFPIHPIIVGDTTHYKDIEITQLNSNPYAFLDNKFPVEVFVRYNGVKPIHSDFSIYHHNKRIFTRKLSLSGEHSSEVLSIFLPADKVGQQYYSASLSPIVNEKNKRNNRMDFSVSVVDQQTKVLLLSSIYHPDLGAIKKSIESNKQRKVTLKIIGENPIKLADYQLIILYQPNSHFKQVFREIKEKKRNSILITGTKTDWRFINQAQTNFYKTTSNQDENFQATYNANYNEFVTDDIDFEQFPPLQDSFGKIEFKQAFQVLLFQKIGSTYTNSPLLATFEVEGSKHAVLFGEGIWRWRMSSKTEKQSFTPFNSFWNSIVQYTATSQKSTQLHLDYDRLCFSNQNETISASYVDQNYKVDTGASLWLQLSNKKTKETQKVPFAIVNGNYQVNLTNLQAGTYFFTVSVAGKTVKKSGSFKVLDYNIEQQFSTANTLKLKKLAVQSGGVVTYADNVEPLLTQLLEDPQYIPVQKSKKIAKALIDWRWLLGFIILSLSAEWFIRKYRGMV